MSMSLDQAARLAARGLTERFVGRVSALRGMTVLVDDLPLPIGASVVVGPQCAHGEVVGFEKGKSVVMLCEATTGISPGDQAIGESSESYAGVGFELLGRCIDGLGRPIDGKASPKNLCPHPLRSTPVAAMRRPPINRALSTGVSAIDLFTTLGRGQRLGIFAGPGVGKSTLLGQIARGTEADINVIALIGERGREVREFVEHSLGAHGLQRSVVVVATSDEPPLLRLRAARLACAAAEYFRDQGRDVLLMMDSVTRFAHAQRQVGLSVGEPPATRGYTPSVFAEMALLMERAGKIEPVHGAVSGSITGLYTILVEGDESSADPIADAARGILDGHVMLSRSIAQSGRFPAIDVLDSVSRVLPQIVGKDHQAARQQIIGLLAAHKQIEELVRVGAYARGSEPKADIAIDLLDEIEGLLRQGSAQSLSMDVQRAAMISLAVRAGDRLNKLAKRQGDDGRKGAAA
jgi:flagellum-specific ATP synthase